MPSNIHTHKQMIPSSPQIHFNRGMIHLSLNDHPSALESFQQSVRRDNKSTRPSPVEFMQLGLLLFWLEKYEVAYENFSIALLVRIYLFFDIFREHNPPPPRYKLIFFPIGDSPCPHKHTQLMDGHSHIQYQNVGLNFCLYASEILFNSAMCLLHLVSLLQFS